MKLWEKALIQGQSALAEEILRLLIEDKGVRSFCAALGARAAPLVKALSALPSLKISPPIETLFFFDERSACFFALGRARRDQRPAAVITTSGTAAAELLPAACEARLCNLPLALLTADRPARERKALSPQTLKDPLKIFSGQTALSLELSLKDLPLFSKREALSLKKAFQKEAPPIKALALIAKGFGRGGAKASAAKNTAARRLRAWDPSLGSLHANIAFEEPLISRPAAKKIKLSLKLLLRQKGLALAARPPLSARFSRDLQKFFSKALKPLVLIGELSQAEAQMAEPLLKRFQGLFYADSLSRLRHLKGCLKSGEGILPCGAKKGAFDGVIRIGGLPRARFWRDLERLPLPVLSLASPPYSKGLARAGGLHPLSLESLEQTLRKISWQAERFKAFDREQARRLREILKELPQSEAAHMSALQSALPEGAHIFLGNSLPIRLWSKAWLFSEKRFQVTGQNGANGIDGLISRFFGEIQPSENRLHAAILGDLSALYDFQGLFAAAKEKQASWRIFIINNFGGRIFQRALPSLPSLINAHSLSFKPFAEMWGLSYSLCKKGRAFSPKDSARIVEIRPSLDETEKCFQKYDALWK